MTRPPTDSGAPSSSASRTVTVQTGARLHFGLLAHRPAAGREFGGLGVMIDAPGWTLLFRRAEHREPASRGATRLRSSVAPRRREASQDLHESLPPETLSLEAARIEGLLSRARAVVPAWNVPVEVRIQSSIPGHCGLGSGTQLALAVLRGLDVLFGADAEPRSAVELSQLAGRGERSAIGTWGFEHGGLLVDGGRRESGTGVLLARYELPPEWCFVLAIPQHVTGLHGPRETSAFRELPGMSAAASGGLCQLLLMELLPALVERQFADVSEALWKYGVAVGEYFAPVQGGVFSSPWMETVARRLRSEGVRGIAQTSWGPACAILCDSRAMAEAVRTRIQELTEREPTSGLHGESPLSVQIVSARHRGASVS